MKGTSFQNWMKEIMKSMIMGASPFKINIKSFCLSFCLSLVSHNFHLPTKKGLKMKKRIQPLKLMSSIKHVMINLIRLPFLITSANINTSQHAAYVVMSS